MLPIEFVETTIAEVIARLRLAEDGINEPSEESLDDMMSLVRSEKDCRNCINLPICSYAAMDIAGYDEADTFMVFTADPIADMPYVPVRHSA